MGALSLAFSTVPASRIAAARTLGRCDVLTLGQGDELGGAVSSTFGEIFGSIFKPNSEKQAEIDRAYAEQLEVLEARKKPGGLKKRLAESEARRAQESAKFTDKFAWQQSADPLKEFKKRREDGRIKDLGYDEEPQGGIPMPMASFGVGGEFGQGGKYDNGERFDLRLPYVEKGWVPEGEEDEGVPFWENLLSGGRLAEEAAARKAAKKDAAAAQTQKKGPFGLF